MHTATILTGFPTYRFNDSFRLFNKPGWWAKFQRFFFTKDIINDLLNDCNPHLKDAELELSRIEEISELRDAEEILGRIVGKLRGIIAFCNKTPYKMFLTSELSELQGLYGTLERFLEDIEDRVDAYDVCKAKEEAKEKGTVSLADVEKELGL